MCGIPFTALEASYQQVDFVRRFGGKVYYGDASRLELLEAARTGEAKLFVLAIDDVEASIKTAQVVRKHFPHIPIFARARNRVHLFRIARPRREAQLARDLPGKPGDGARGAAFAGLSMRGLGARHVPVKQQTSASSKRSTPAARRSAAHTVAKEAAEQLQACRGRPAQTPSGFLGPLRPPARAASGVRRAFTLGVVAIALASRLAQTTQRGEVYEGAAGRVTHRVLRPATYSHHHLATRAFSTSDPVSSALARSGRYYAESVQGEREAVRLFEAGQFEDGRRLEP